MKSCAKGKNSNWMCSESWMKKSKSSLSLGHSVKNISRKSDYYFSDLLVAMNMSSVPEDYNNSTYFFARFLEML